ncbi:hypothetical protein PISMIDRAFT_497241 [Pisolithus microcarpus 441]|uniref:Uncharacterized protein n=1 Tax=Pisolithus microcarpus 441 TaxID=765257 RepID=A0A0C9ZJ68_9AGAM|nr:hypothetical protein PISMIDRAFT_495157 [Pisolithus microcarpus 441]KIK22507.1 hypothetical protein PISMIDRAFT_497241 [Pisolithus microcarpus 441]
MQKQCRAVASDLQQIRVGRQEYAPSRVRDGHEFHQELSDTMAIGTNWTMESMLTHHVHHDRYWAWLGSRCSGISANPNEVPIRGHGHLLAGTFDDAIKWGTSDLPESSHRQVRH